MSTASTDRALRELRRQGKEADAHPKLTRMDLLKLFGGIPASFLKEYEVFRRKGGMNQEPTIDVREVATWLGTNKAALMKTLSYGKYKEGTEFIRRKVVVPGRHGGQGQEEVLLTFDCMRELAMASRAPRSNEVRQYFVKLDNFQDKFHRQILAGILADVEHIARRDLREDTKDGPGYLYALRASAALDQVFKLGRARNLAERLAVYNVGLAEDREFDFAIPVQFAKEAERCLAHMLRNRRLRKRREVYEVDFATVIRLIRGCAGLTDAMGALSEEPEMMEQAERPGSMADRFYLAFLTPEDLARARNAVATKREEMKNT